jgi:hypothetical protein
MAQSSVAKNTVVRAARQRQASKVAEIREALIVAGVHSITLQAKALGLSRSTTWAILQRSHKSSGLSAAIINRMLASPNLQPTVRRTIEEYVHEKLVGAYGHDTRQLRLFRALLG